MNNTEIVKGIKPCQYRYKNGDDKLHLGVIAQDVIKYFPVETHSIVKVDSDGFYSVDYSQLVPILLKQVQELTDRVSELENKNKM